MKKKIIFLLFAILFSVNEIYANYQTYESFFNSILNVKPDKTKIFQVKDFYFVKDVAKFHLIDGYLVFGEQINGIYRIAYFVGKGNFKFTPPLEVEKYELQRLCNKDKYDKEFANLFLVCGDSLLYSINTKFSPIEINDSKPVLSEFRDVLGCLQSYHSKQINFNIEETLLNNQINRLFFAKIGFRDEFHKTFIINPDSYEDVSFNEVSWKYSFGMSSKNICKFPSQNNLKYDIVNYNPDNIQINSYKITQNFKGLDSVSKFSCEINGKILKDNNQWNVFYLNRTFKIDSIVDLKNNKLSFYKEADYQSIKFKLAENLNIGDDVSIIFYYSGISSYINWFPYNANKTNAIFDLTFITPKDYKTICIGDKVAEKIIDSLAYTRWITKKTINFPGGNIGQYIKIDTSDYIPISVYQYSSDSKQIINTITTSYRFYNNIFGGLSIEKLDACVVPSIYNVAYPGFIQISIFSISNSSYDIKAIAHSVANQWWGASVRNKTYRDSWLVNGFAKYSSLLYFQTATQENEMFFNTLKYNKDDMISYQDKCIKDEIMPSSLALGDRHYYTYSYEKGAWILHMLRNMFLDFKTMKDDAFFNMMKDFFIEYKNKYVTCEDFKRILEKHTRTDMTWFFDQWVYQSLIPKYTFGWKVEPTADGKYLIKMRVKQDVVDSTFIMPIPLKVNFGENKFYNFRINVTGKIAELTSAPMPLKPQDIEFNYLESVLCDWEKEDYEDIQ